MAGPIRKLVLGWFAGLALSTTTVAAQDDVGSDSAEEMAALAQMFPAEPLTAEQAARLPQARAIIERVMPQGTMQDIMGDLFGNVLGPMMETEVADPASAVTEILGYSVFPPEENAAEIVAILDPVWEERRRREMAEVPLAIGRMMAEIEPAMRNVMAELYAIHFTAEELTGIDAFFATPIGATYARESFRMTSDPRLMASMMQAAPGMIASMSSMEEAIAAATADLPPVRSYRDLTTSQRKRLARLLGVAESELQYSLGGPFQPAWVPAP